MNEQLQSKLVEILTGIQEATKAAGDFAMTQLPDIAQSYVMYGRAMHTAGLIFGIALAIALLVLAVKQWQAIRDLEPWPIPVFMFGGAASLAFVGANFGPAMLVWLAPKVWLLKELAGMVR